MGLQFSQQPVIRSGYESVRSSGHEVLSCVLTLRPFSDVQFGYGSDCYTFINRSSTPYLVFITTCNILFMIISYRRVGEYKTEVSAGMRFHTDIVGGHIDIESICRFRRFLKLLQNLI